MSVDSPLSGPAVMARQTHPPISINPFWQAASSCHKLGSPCCVLGQTPLVPETLNVFGLGRVSENASSYDTEALLRASQMPLKYTGSTTQYFFSVSGWFEEDHIVWVEDSTGKSSKGGYTLPGTPHWVKGRGTMAPFPASAASLVSNIETNWALLSEELFKPQAPHQWAPSCCRNVYLWLSQEFGGL